MNLKLDIFAESTDKRIVVEIQRVPYDYNFDRFLHYFLMTIAEQQKSSKEYIIPRTVYVVVIMTAPYKFNEKSGHAVRDEVLLLKLNPKTLAGIERELYGHQLIFLNPNHPDQEMPAQIRDWLDLIYQSIHIPERLVLNEDNAGVQRAAKLIDFDNLTPEERALAKDEASRLTYLALEDFDNKRKDAKKYLREGMPLDVVLRVSGLTQEEIERE